MERAVRTHLYLFKVLILLDVERFVVVKPQRHGLGHALEAVQDGKVVRAGARGGVVERGQGLDSDAPLRIRHGRLRRNLGALVLAALHRGLQVLVEAAIGPLRRPVEVHKLVRADQEDRVRALGRHSAAVKAHDGELPQLVIQLVAKAGELPQIQRPEVQEEIPVHQFVVDIEEVDLLLRRGRVGFGPARRRSEDVVRGRGRLQRCIV